MSDSQSSTKHNLIEFKVDRVIDESATDTRIVVLTRADSPTDSVPIWVGAAEGSAIKLAMDTMVTPRPMSHDLIKSFVEHLGVTVRRVVITDVKSSTYYATVYLENKGVERSIDARRHAADSRRRRLCRRFERPVLLVGRPLVDPTLDELLLFG